MPRLIAVFLSLNANRRRPRVQVNLRRQLVMTTSLVVSLLAAHVVAIVAFEDDINVGTAVWLTLTTVTTVGYGDVSAESFLGRASTVLLLYFGAVLVFARVASVVVEYRMDRRDRQTQGTWRWHLRDHIVILGTPESGATMYLKRLLEQLTHEPIFEHVPVLVLTTEYPEGLPPELADLGLVHYTAAPEDPGALEACDAADARHIVLLARHATDPHSDIINVDMVHRIREMHVGATVVVEVVDDRNRERFRRYGVNNVVRPSRTYPELLVRSMAAPGSEVVVEELLSGTGSVIRRYDVRIVGWTWAKLGQVILGEGHGTPLGYVGRDGNVVSNPPAGAVVDGYGLIVMSHAGQVAQRAELLELVRAGELTGIA